MGMDRYDLPREAVEDRIKVSKNPIMFGRHIGFYSASWLCAAVYTGCVFYFIARRADHAFLIAVNARAAAHLCLLIPLLKRNPRRHTVVRACRVGTMLSVAAALIMVLPVAVYPFYRSLAGLLTTFYYLLTACADSALLVVARESGRNRGVPAFFTAGYSAAMLCMMGILMTIYMFWGVKVMFIYETCLLIHGGMFLPVISVFSFVMIREGKRMR